MKKQNYFTFFLKFSLFDMIQITKFFVTSLTGVNKVAHKKQLVTITISKK